GGTEGVRGEDAGGAGSAIGVDAVAAGRGGRGCSQHSAREGGCEEIVGLHIEAARVIGGDIGRVGGYRGGGGPGHRVPAARGGGGFWEWLRGGFYFGSQSRGGGRRSRYRWGCDRT